MDKFVKTSLARLAAPACPAIPSSVALAKVEVSTTAEVFNEGGLAAP
jgi:hypothetical protein